MTYNRNVCLLYAGGMIQETIVKTHTAVFAGST